MPSIFREIAVPVDIIKLSGAIDLEILRVPGATTAGLWLECEDVDALEGVNIRAALGVLEVDTGSGISISGGSISIDGSNNFSGSNITIGAGGDIVGGSIVVNGSVIKNAPSSQIKARLEVPDAPNIHIRGCGRVVARDIDQAKIEVQITGSGSVELFGKADILEATIAGSGDIEAEELLAKSVDVSIAGSGDVSAFADSASDVSISGSGGARIYGNPASKRQSVVGSGCVRYK